MIYLTGDTHGRFERIGIFCDKMQTSRDYILIILGDAGINFHAGALDILRKEYLAKLPITLLCIHGNHERRPESLPYYDEQEWYGGKVYVEARYPNTIVTPSATSSYPHSENKYGRISTSLSPSTRMTLRANIASLDF